MSSSVKRNIYAALEHSKYYHIHSVISEVHIDDKCALETPASVKMEGLDILMMEGRDLTLCDDGN